MTLERIIEIKVQSTTKVGSKKRIVNIFQRRLSGVHNGRMLAQESDSTINH